MIFEKSAITPNGLHYGQAYYDLSPKPIKVKSKIDSYLCGYCEDGKHDLHAYQTAFGKKCECLLCAHK